MSQTVSSIKQQKYEAGVARVDMKLEVNIIPVSDVERSKLFYLIYARRRNQCWRVDGATPFGTPENSALKRVGPRSSELREPILRRHPNGERSTTAYLPNAR
jgi:hypothetical protein